jgi:hypothetical protein
MFVAKLPPFTDQGILPPGDYPLTFLELQESILVGFATPNWDATWRLALVNQCEVMVNQLWQVGITEIFLDGSFVEEKSHPNDIDGYFECDLKQLASGDLQRQLNALDPHKIWTWDPSSRRAYRGDPKKQLPMWHRYRTELYPHVGQPSGIQDSLGHQLTFPSAFRQQRNTHAPKGVIKILKDTGGGQT